MYNGDVMRSGVMTLMGLCLLAAAAAASGEPGSLSDWRARLSNPSREARRFARSQLLENGPVGRAILLALCGDRDPRVRQEVAFALGELDGATARARLFALFFDVDPLVSRTAASSLTRHGRAAHQQTLARLGKSTDSRERQRLHWLLQRILSGMVEQMLQAHISPTGGIGSWADKFRALKRYRPGCVDVLLRLFSDPSYRTVYRLELPPDNKRLNSVRSLAGMALAEMGDRSKRVRRALVGMLSEGELKDHWESARTVLYRLGHPRLLDRRLRELKGLLANSLARPAGGRIGWLQELASCYYVKRDYRQSVAAYRSILRLEPRNDSALYNMACSYALMGKVDEAIESLKRAIEAGFVDRAHILADRDLKNVRQDPRFKSQILGHARLGGGE